MASTDTSTTLTYNNSDSVRATAVTVGANYSSTLSASNYSSNVVTINASKRSKAINITGNAKNNVIIGGSGNDTLGGGTGNDTLTGGAGNDIFIYSAGNDVITDYGTGNDTIKLANSGASVSSYSISGSDAVFKIGSNTLKVKNGKTKSILLADSSNKVNLYDSGLIYNDSTTARSTIVTVTAGYGNKLVDSVYGSNVTTIDASSRTKAINITGNAKDNSIIGSSANDTLGGGRGNDTLTGGNGKDLFVYTSGNDVITDYTAGQDTIRATVGAIADYSLSGSDAIFKIGNLGTVKVLNGKTSAVTIVDSSKKALTYQNALIYNNAAVAKATALTVLSAADGTLGSSSYGTNVITLDSSSRTNAINLTGNAKANIIKGGAGNDTLAGGKGNDTLYGNGGNDIFIYNSGDGNDVIADYTAGQDTIQIASGTISSYTVKSNDLTLKIGSGSIKVTGGKNNAITIVDADSQTTTYQSGLIYNGASTTKATAVSVTANYGNTLTAASLASSSITSIDASSRTVAMRITGNSNANYIVATSKNDIIDGGSGDNTIRGGAGNDTITGGGGKNVFVYASGDGNDVITDYSAGEDTIKIVSGSVTSYTVNGSNAILKVGSGTMTLRGVGDGAIIIADADDNTKIYKNGLIYDGTSIARSKSLTVTSAYSGDLDSYGANVVTIDASARTTAVEIVGNAADNLITGGTKADTLEGGDGDDTLIGGKGADTLIGGNGKDVFYYTSGDGNDVIVDYTSGDDVIRLGNSGANIAYSIDSVDAFIKIGTGTITLKDAASASITVIGADDIATLCVNGTTKTINDPNAVVLPDDIQFNSTDTITATAATITSDYESTTFNAAAYASLITIDASARSALNITGNAFDNVIKGGSGNASLSGGVGDDTIYGGSGNTTMIGGAGNDVFVYEAGDNYQIISDYVEGEDIVSLSGITSVDSGMVSGSDVIFTFGDGILRLKNARNKSVTLATSSGETEYVNGATVDHSPDAEGLTVTLSSIFSGDFSLEDYNAILNTPANNIDASLSVNRNTLRGNDDDNFIWAGMGGSDIYPGQGDDVIFCNNGNDTIFVYSDGGNDSVYSYAANEKSSDCIYLASTTVKQFQNISLSGNDVIVNLNSSQSVTLKDARERMIYIYDALDSTVGTSATYKNTFGKVTVSGNAVTLDADYSGTFNPVYYANSISNIDASRVKNFLTIYGDSNANTITTGDVGMSISAGAGNDTVISGNGNDSIRYTSGNDVIYNYRAGDFIDFGTNDLAYQLSYVSFRDNDVILNLQGGNKITLKDAIDQQIHIRGNNPDAFDYNSTFGKVTFTSGTAVLSADYKGTFNSTQYNTTVSDIDASAVTDEVVIYGNSLANVIHGGQSYSYIYASAGNDTIYCGAGGGYVDGGAGNDQIYLGGVDNEAIRYTSGGGNDTVYNFQAGDYIYLSSNEDQFKGVSLTDDDIVINLISGNKITLVDARHKYIRVNDTDANGGYNNYEATFGNVVISSSAVSLNSDYTGLFNLSYYDDSPANVDASAVTSSNLNLIGDSYDNVIRAGKNGGTITGGAGNDTIYCGAGVDVINYSADGESDVIVNIGDGDKLYMNNAQTSTVSIVDADVVITTVSEKTITIKDGVDKDFEIDDVAWSNYAENYSGTASSADLFEDDNFAATGADLDSLLDVAQISGVDFSTKDSLSTFAQDLQNLTYNSTNQK